ncbi:tol-pal system protein YbgF [Candidatus Nitrospira bockiana]
MSRCHSPHRPQGRRPGLLIGGLLCFLLSGCLAQQAELNQVKGDLGKQIKQLDQRDRELQQTVKQAKLDIDKLVSETRARLSQEISALREEELPALRGGLDKDSHQLAVLRSRVDDVEHQLARRVAGVEKAQSDQASTAKAERDRLHEEVGRLTSRIDGLNARLEAMNGTVASMVKTLGGRLDEQDKALTAGEGRIQQLEAQGRTLTEQMAQYGKALADYKKALTGLGEKFVQEEQRLADLSNKVSGRTDALTAKVENDAKTTTAHLNDVNKSVASVAKALETVSGQVISRVEEQDRRLDEMMKNLHGLDAQLATLNQAVLQLRSTREAPPRSVEESRPQSGPGDALAAPAPASIPSTVPQPAPPDPGAHSQSPRDVRAREVYDRHIATFKHGDFDAALQGFTQFLADYPTSDLAANAQYWLGECLYGKKDYARAIEAFDRVKTAYPHSDKVPAALLKKGFAYLALKDRNRASSVWRQVVDGYPNSPEAGKALEKLAQLKQIR